jgi:type I restriction enzyme S subunit
MVCTRITDGSHYSPKGITEGFPMLSVKDMLHHGFSYDDCKYISEDDYNDMLKSDCVPLVNDVLIAKDGSYLKHVFVIKEEKKQGILSSIGILRPNLKKINPEYLKYYLHSNSVKVTVAKKYVSGSALPRIILKNFGEIDVIYKPLIEQQKIAKVLSDLDAKIELNNRINSELEAMAKTLYDYWFVQFDFPDANGKPYKSSGGKMVWNEELKREIPVGWEAKTLLDIANFVNGLACQKFRPKENENSYRVIKIREMGTGFTENSEFVSRNIPEKVVIYNGDILFSWSATLDVKIWTGGTGALNQHIFKITSKNFPKSYYYFELLNYLQHFKMQAELRKTTMGHITQDHLKQSRITIPPSDLIHKLDEILKPILEKKVKLEEENQELASVRDWLLPMLMNGQVNVGEVEEVLGMVAEEGERYGK